MLSADSVFGVVDFLLEQTITVKDFHLFLLWLLLNFFFLQCYCRIFFCESLYLIMKFHSSNAKSHLQHYVSKTGSHSHPEKDSHPHYQQKSSQKVIIPNMRKRNRLNHQGPFFYHNFVFLVTLSNIQCLIILTISTDSRVNMALKYPYLWGL